MTLPVNLLLPGAGTALLGKEGAMACTVAVEDVIGGHYNSQIRQLMEDDPVKHKELLEVCDVLCVVLCVMCGVMFDSSSS